MAKVFDVYVDRRRSGSNTQEFDVFLNRHMTECDIIVYSLPYRRYASGASQMILEDCLKSYILQRFVASQSDTELVSHIDKMIKECFVRLNEELNISSTASGGVLKHSAILGSDITLEAQTISASSDKRAVAISAIEAISEELHTIIAKGVTAPDAPLLIDSEPAVSGKSSRVSGDSAMSIEFIAPGLVSKDIQVSPAPNSIEIDSSVVPAVLVRYRLLSDMDEYPLGDFDDMPLSEVDFIVK